MGGEGMEGWQENLHHPDPEHGSYVEMLVSPFSVDRGSAFFSYHCQLVAESL